MASICHTSRWSLGAAALFGRGRISIGLGIEPDWAYFAASAHSRAGELDDAMHMLVVAVEDGWREFEHLAADPDLEPLCAREDYHALMARGPEPEPVADSGIPAASPLIQVDASLGEHFGG